MCVLPLLQAVLWHEAERVSSLVQVGKLSMSMSQLAAVQAFMSCRAARIIQSAWRKRSCATKAQEAANCEFREQQCQRQHAALIVQTWWRGHVAKMQAELLRKEQRCRQRSALVEHVRRNASVLRIQVRLPIACTVSSVYIQTHVFSNTS